MSVICPRCHARCADDDIYCFNCGGSLAGVPRQPEREFREGAADADVSPGTASTWPDRVEDEGDRMSSHEPPAETPRSTPDHGDPDFVPLTFEPSRLSAPRPRRWVLLGVAFIALLAVGVAAAMVWQGGSDDKPEQPLVVIDPTPNPTARARIVATPATPSAATPARLRPSAAATPSIATNPTANPTPETSPTAAPTTTPTPEPSPTAAPTAVSRRAALSEVALLPAGLLRDMGVGEAVATPPASPSPVVEAGEPSVPTRGDGTGGVILLPGAATEVPASGPAQRTPTPDAP